MSSAAILKLLQNSLFLAADEIFIFDFYSFLSLFLSWVNFIILSKRRKVVDENIMPNAIAPPEASVCIPFE